LKKLDDDILRMLTESKVSLIDDIALIDALKKAKDTGDEVKE